MKTEQDLKEEYEEKLIKYKLSIDFANKLGIFQEHIIDKQLTGEERHINFGDKYKDICFCSPIYRVFYIDKNNVTNCEIEFNNKYLFSIYINTLTCYNSHETYGLNDIIKLTNVFFYDEINSTFYIEDEYIKEFFEKLMNWYKDASKKARIKNIENYISKYKKDIADLEIQLNELKESDTNDG